MMTLIKEVLYIMESKVQIKGNIKRVIYVLHVIKYMFGRNTSVKTAYDIINRDENLKNYLENECRCY